MTLVTTYCPGCVTSSVALARAEKKIERLEIKYDGRLAELKQTQEDLAEQHAKTERLRTALEAIVTHITISMGPYAELSTTYQIATRALAREAKKGGNE